MPSLISMRMNHCAIHSHKSGHCSYFPLSVRVCVCRQLWRSLNPISSGVNRAPPYTKLNHISAHPILIPGRISQPP